MNNYLPFLLCLTLITTLPCSSHTLTTKHLHSELELKRVTVSILSGLVCGFLTALLIASIITCFIHFINTPPILNGPVIFSPKLNPTTLRLLALHFPTPIPTHFNTPLDNGLHISVKTLDLHPLQTNNKSLNRNIHHQLQLLASFKHRNILSLRAYLHHSNRFSLVYDYIPTGSLDDAINKLRQNHLLMGWDVRLRIAVGIIKALNFLHFECNPTVLHCNLKPSNVMLDAEFEPKLADCGLANLVPRFCNSPNEYRAPELSQNCRYTDKSDVFSFGVMLGVLLTGRDPLDPFFGEATNGGCLGRWLRHLQQAGEARQALDKSLLGQESEEDEMLMAVRIALVCMSESPQDRPSSDELVPMLSRLHSF